MVVVDSSVLIHLLRIGKLFLLKDFFKKIIITKEIYDEILSGNIGVSEFEDAYNDWIIVNEKKFDETKKISEMENIEKPDASIILLAKEKKDILLSNDYFLIIVAKSKGIKCWWLTTFLLECLKKSVLTKKETKQILLDLINSGMRLRNDVYAAILQEIDRL